LSTFPFLRNCGSAIAAALLTLVLSVCAPALAQSPSATPGIDFAKGRVLVMSKAGLSAAELDSAVGAHGGRARRLGRSELHVVDLPAGANEPAVAAALARHPHFKFAELDRRVAAAAVVNDPYVGSQWHLAKIGAATAWDRSQGSGVTIAILDSGIDATHPDLAARMVPGWNFIDNSADTSDVNGHGTAVAGAAAATLNNGIGVAAVAGLARLMPVRIADANAYAYWSTVAQGLTWAADNGARVANISYVGVASSASVQSAANYMRSKGGLVVVAAGNNNIDENIAPTSSMIPVAATDEADAKTSFSSWGQFVAVSAPGINIWTTTRGGAYQAWWGTSMASPVVAGAVALMMSSNPSLPAAQIESLLYASAVDLGAAGRDPVFGHGRLNAAGAVQAAAAAVSTADTQAPTVAITSPAANGTASGVVAVAVAASDNVGVARVELRVNGSTVATDTSAPFAFSWDTSKVANGTASLTAVAFDAAGNTSSSAAVQLNVANAAAPDIAAPTVVMRNPVAGATVSGNVQVQLSASDNYGSAGIVQTLFIDGVKVASATGASLTYTWNTRKVAAGAHTLMATARDAAGNQSTVSISVRR
jgi:thermitase